MALQRDREDLPLAESAIGSSSDRKPFCIRVVQIMEVITRS